MSTRDKKVYGAKTDEELQAEIDRWENFTSNDVNKGDGGFSSAAQAAANAGSERDDRDRAAERAKRKT